jgi:hypothetical protein
VCGEKCWFFMLLESIKARTPYTDAHATTSLPPWRSNLDSSSKQAREHATDPHPPRADAVERRPDVEVEYRVAIVVGRGRIVVDDVSDLGGRSGRVREDGSVDDPVVTIERRFGATIEWGASVSWCQSLCSETKIRAERVDLLEL